VATLAACGGSDDSREETDFASDIQAAIDAVEMVRGPGQEFFEVTATPQLTNVFVATDDATAAVPYVYLDGVLEPPAPVLAGVSGHTFVSGQIEFDEETILSQIVEQLPDATIESLSVEGGQDGTVRYIASVRSAAGGFLDVTVSPNGVVLEVDPV
jgi:hypothetical protein